MKLLYSFLLILCFGTTTLFSQIIRADESVLFENCWAFYNGYSASFQSLGDGNGFKVGGYAFDTADKIPNPVPRNTVRFCVAVRNKASGFYSNHHLAGNDWYNNTAYQNNYNFNMVNRESPQIDDIWVDGYDHVLKNNLSYKPYGFGRHTAYIALFQNYPNPFYPQTNIGYALSESGYINLSVYNIFGQKIRTLVGQNQPSGEFTVSWNGENDLGARVASGIYFYRLSTSNASGSHATQKKMMLLK